jgi:hypothetical protein
MGSQAPPIKDGKFGVDEAKDNPRLAYCPVENGEDLNATRELYARKGKKRGKKLVGVGHGGREKPQSHDMSMPNLP